ncbi:MAG: hypothetical protein QOG83_3317 [Alphaproteobacteria bacterium]|nr:hypothetical protein [Alphaproteobacteria bacterium]
MTKLGTGIVVVALGTALAGLLAGDASTVGIAPAPAAKATRGVFAEVTWPFPLDQWGRGRAYRCAAADCGTEISVYLRAKIGFCNCSTGVSDDEELDRVGDLEIFSDKWVGLADGRAITVGHMNGRSRPYHVTMRYTAPVSAVAIGFNDKCDVAVATVVAEREQLAIAERLAVEFLNSNVVLSWAAGEIGL